MVEMVTILAPMKRGLKGHDIEIIIDATGGYNPCPDEKGTESIVITGGEPFIQKVTTYSSMKRGLKEKKLHRSCTKAAPNL